MNTVVIYTDGSCIGNPGPGGWAAILECKGYKKEIVGNEKYSTNNRMEITAVIKALEALTKPCKVIMHCDSAYVVDAHNKGWLTDWSENNWTHGRKHEEVANADLWIRLLKAEEQHEIDWCKVKGHAGIPENEIVDKLANEAAQVAAK